MGKINRRTFFKAAGLSLGALAIFKDNSIFMSKAFAAARKDDGITKFDYSKDVNKTAPKVAKFAADSKKSQKFFEKNPEFKVPATDTVALCQYCTFYEKVDAEWGWCTQLARKNNKEGQQVSSHAWCNKFVLNNKGKLKKVLGA